MDGSTSPHSNVEELCSLLRLGMGTLVSGVLGPLQCIILLEMLFSGNIVCNWTPLEWTHHLSVHEVRCLNTEHFYQDSLAALSVVFSKLYKTVMLQLPSVISENEIAPVHLSVFCYSNSCQLSNLRIEAATVRGGCLGPKALRVQMRCSEWVREIEGEEKKCMAGSLHGVRC